MKKTAFFIAFMAIIGAVQAQKVGYVNSRNLLVEMPEAARADSLLAIYQKQLSVQGDSLAKVFETEYQAFQSAYAAGTLSQQQAQKRQEELKKRQEILQSYAQDADQKLSVLRSQLLQPLIDKMDTVITAIGKEGGYDAIFDTSLGDALYGLPSLDLSSEVRKRLGLPEPKPATDKK